jgi:hypothetical protein
VSRSGGTATRFLGGAVHDLAPSRARVTIRGCRGRTFRRSRRAVGVAPRLNGNNGAGRLAVHSNPSLSGKAKQLVLARVSRQMGQVRLCSNRGARRLSGPDDSTAIFLATFPRPLVPKVATTWSAFRSVRLLWPPEDSSLRIVLEAVIDRGGISHTRRAHNALRPASPPPFHIWTRRDHAREPRVVGPKDNR